MQSYDFYYLFQHYGCNMEFGGDDQWSNMHPDFEKTDFSCYRYLVTGAAPTGRELLEIYWAKGVKMVNAYGMTEVGPNNMSHPAGNASCTIEDVRAKWNSCGVPAPYNQVRFVDEEGNDVKQGERGEILFKSKLIFSGYWRNKEAADAIMPKLFYGSDYHLGKTQVETFEKTRSLMEVFKSLPYRRVGVDVKI